MRVRSKIPTANAYVGTAHMRYRHITARIHKTGGSKKRGRGKGIVERVGKSGDAQREMLMIEVHRVIQDKKRQMIEQDTEEKKRKKSERERKREEVRGG